MRCMGAAGNTAATGHGSAQAPPGTAMWLNRASCFPAHDSDRTWHHPFSPYSSSGSTTPKSVFLPASSCDGAQSHSWVDEGWDGEGLKCVGGWVGGWWGGGS